MAPFIAVHQCTSVTKSCTRVNRKLGYLTPKLSVWFPKIFNPTQRTENKLIPLLYVKGTGKAQEFYDTFP